MNILDALINRPLGFLLGEIYALIGSYGLAIILFTLIVKIVLFPLSINQQKTMARTGRIQPKIKEIEKKYKGDKQKQSEELMKLYQKEGINPASGCLPLLIQMPFIYALYNIVNKPLSYLVGLTQEQILLITEKMNLLTADGIAYTLDGIKNAEITIAHQISTSAATIPSEFSGMVLIDFNFLGMNLASRPSWGTFDTLLLIPIIACASAFASSYLMSKISATNATNAQAKTMNKSMMLMMPVMSLMLCFSVPAGVGLYWAMSNMFTIVQQYVLNKMYPPSKADNNHKPSDQDTPKKNKPIRGVTLND